MTCEGGLGRQAPKSAELDSEWEDSDFPTRRGSRETLVLSGDSFTDILGDGRQTKGRRPAGTKKISCLKDTAQGTKISFLRKLQSLSLKSMAFLRH